MEVDLVVVEIGGGGRLEVEERVEEVELEVVLGGGGNWWRWNRWRWNYGGGGNWWWR